MADVLRELEGWFAGRPAWIQEALRLFVQKAQIAKDDLERLVKICKAEVGLYENGTKPIDSNTPPKVSLNAPSGKSIIQLTAIYNPKGINALGPRRPLEFGKSSLAVIYGQNGSGKSGYIRALKHASGQRKPGALLPNAFSDRKDVQSCGFRYEIDGLATETQWEFPSGPVEDLRRLQVYDSNSASLYINEENEASYEPPILSLFTQLTDICGRVNSALEAEIQSIPSRKPSLPPELQQTPSGIWCGRLSHLTGADEIIQKCDWPVELEVELLRLNQRLVEADPKEKAKSIRKQKDRLLDLHKELLQWTGKLSDKNCEGYFAALRDSEIKRKAADTDAAIVFANAPLDGVGSEVWKLLWEQARAFSERIAYRGIQFPNTTQEARCVLCQQFLDDEAKQRFSSFESFVRGGLEVQAVAAENHLKHLYDNFAGFASDEALNLRMDSVNLTTDAERQAVISFCSSLDQRRGALLAANQLSQIPPAPDEIEIQFLKSQATDLEGQAAVFDQDALGENRPTLENTRNELVAHKWLSQQRAGIQNEVGRLRGLQSLREAQKLTNTQSLSMKKSSLTESLITSAYIERFQSELAGLGAARIKVKLVKTRAERGHVFHEIRLEDPKRSVAAAEILSEGEFRIVSLAAFLADVEIRGDGCPFIFDDPISSLDHIFEEAMARRLVELCKSRQVIVFTHRLSLLEYVQSAAEKAGIDPTVVSLRREHWGLGEPGEPSMGEMKPGAAIEQLTKELKEAREVLEQSGQTKYEALAKGICGDLRIAIERIIEKILISDVVKRHSREIQTKGRIKDLAKITVEDCNFFDQLMTKYSAYEHSQPEETPKYLPSPDEIAADLTLLKNWIAAFKARPSA